MSRMKGSYVFERMLHILSFILIILLHQSYDKNMDLSHFNLFADRLRTENVKCYRTIFDIWYIINRT